MNNLIKAYDLGSSNVVETCQRVSVDKLVRTATKIVKKRIVEAQIEALGMSLNLTTSKTRFNGERLWFICPICRKRAGNILYNALQNLTGCRKCLRLIYRKQRFKGMIEEN